MGRIKALDHVGITVTDLDAAIEFFTKLGLELDGRQFVEGEFLDTVCGLTDARTEIAMLRVPGAETAVELSSFVRPDLRDGPAEALANETGLRSVAFVVDEVAEMVAALAEDGFPLIGGVGEYEGVWRMAYVRGPDGITVALAERLG